MNYTIKIWPLFVLFLLSCGNEDAQNENVTQPQGNGNDTSSAAQNIEPMDEDSTNSDKPAQTVVAYFLNEKANITDSLFQMPSVLHEKGLLNKPVTFPKGLACVVQEMPDSCLLFCDLSNLEHTQFKSSSKTSLFTNKNVQNVFFFLTQIDSSKLYYGDCNYSLLRFMRHKTYVEGLDYIISDSVEEHVDAEPFRQITWNNDIEVNLYEDGQVFTSGFSHWKEFWNCRKDHATPYPFIDLSPTELVKAYPEEHNDDWGYKWFRHPQFVFSTISSGGSSLPIELKGASQNAVLLKHSGEKVDGIGIDLNGDNLLDAFWYTEYVTVIADYSETQWITRLYLKIEGEWQTIWYKHFDELKVYQKY